MWVIKCDVCGSLVNGREWNSGRRVNIDIDGVEVQLCNECGKRIISYVERMKHEKQGGDWPDETH